MPSNDVEIPVARGHQPPLLIRPFQPVELRNSGPILRRCGTALDIEHFPTVPGADLVIGSIWIHNRQLPLLIRCANLTVTAVKCLDTFRATCHKHLAIRQERSVSMLTWEIHRGHCSPSWSRCS